MFAHLLETCNTLKEKGKKLNQFQTSSHMLSHVARIREECPFAQKQMRMTDGLLYAVNLMDIVELTSQYKSTAGSQPSISQLVSVCY